jgi:thiamine-monophosphate kinase
MQIHERQFTELLRQRAAGSGVPGLRQGIGDDCAVLAHTRQRNLLVTTDLFLEDIHFRRRWQEPASLGHKALARGLSDIAAMGGTPRFVFLSLGLPRKGSQSQSLSRSGFIPADLDAVRKGTASAVPKKALKKGASAPEVRRRFSRGASASGEETASTQAWSQRWLDGFLEGFLRLAAASKVVLAGGDTGSSAGGFLADVVVVGDVPRGRAILRSGARPGDEIWVSGKLGTAALGLALLQRGKKLGPAHPAFQAFCYPEPRLRIGQYLLRRRLASALMDLSDGLSIDLARMCEASGVGARIDAAAIPRLAQTPLHDALHGGEDLELLFTVPPKRSRHLPRSIGGVPLTRIGRITSERKLWLIPPGRDGRKQPLPILGFQHF